MKICVHNTILILTLICTLRLEAQVGLSLPIINEAVPGTVIQLPVRVHNFDSIASMQYVIRWDTAVLRFASVSLLNLQELTLSDFNLNNALDSGMIRVVWETTSTLSGVTVPDNTPIFRINFAVQGPINSGSPVYFTSAFPTVFEISQANADSSLTSYSLQTADVQPGFVAVGYMVSTDEVKKDAFPMHVFPNPSSAGIRCDFEISAACPVNIFLQDMSGQTILQRNLGRLTPGRYQELFDKKSFPQAGTFLLTIHAGNQKNVRRILVF